MKKYIVALVVLFLVLVAMPWGIGRVAEQRENAWLDRVAKEAPYLTIADRKWSSGWFRSEQEVTFEVVGPWTDIINKAAHPQATGGEAATRPAIQKIANGEVTGAAEDSAPADTPAEQAPAKPATPFRFTVHNEILHGPVLWPFGFGIARVNSKLLLSEDIRKVLVENFGTDDPVRISTRLSFLGGGVTTFAGDGRSLKGKKDEGTFKYDDFRLDIGYSKDFDRVYANGGWPHFEFIDGKTGENVSVDGIDLESKSKRLVEGVYEGSAKFSVSKMRFVGPDKAETSIDDLHYIVDTNAKGDYLEFPAKIGSGKVRNKQLSDIKLELDEVHYDLTLRHLHIETLGKLATAFKELYSKPMNATADLDAAFTAPFKQYGIELLKHDPELSIDNLGIVTPEGKGIITGVIRVRGVTDHDFDGSAMGLIPRIEADLTIEVAQKLLEKIPNGNTSVGVAVDQGYARRDGDRIVSRVEFSHSELKINGKPQAIPGLGGPGAEPPKQE